MMLYFTSVVNQLLSFVLPLQFEKMDFRIAALGLQLSFFSAGALFSRVLLLNLIREENMKKFAAFGLGLMAVACSGFLLFTEAVPAMLCRILQGTAFGIASSAVPSVAMRFIETPEKSVGLIGIASIMASLTGPYLALEIVKRSPENGFRLVCLLAVLAAMAGFLLCMWIPAAENGGNAVEKQKKGLPGKTAVYLFFTASFLILCNCYMALLTVFADSEGKLKEVVIFLVASSLSSILIRTCLKEVMKTQRRLHGLLFFGAVLYCAAMLWVGKTPGRSSFLAGGTAVGFFSGIMMSCAHLDILRLDDKDSAHANTLFYCVQDIANILCGVLWALAASWLGYGMSFVWSGVGILVICGVYILFRKKVVLRK